MENRWLSVEEIDAWRAEGHRTTLQIIETSGCWLPQPKCCTVKRYFSQLLNFNGNWLLFFLFFMIGIEKQGT